MHKQWHLSEETSKWTSFHRNQIQFTVCNLVWLFSIFTTQIIFAMVETDNSALDQIHKKCFGKCHILLTNAKQKLFLSFIYCSNYSTVNFPICCSAQEVPLETTQHAQYTHRKHQERVTGQVISNKCSQASFCLRCQDKEQSCSHCPMPQFGGNTSFWYLRRMKKERQSWENASELYTSAKTSPTRFLPLMPQLIFGFPLRSPSTLGTLQLKAGAATNWAVRHCSCCSKRLLSSTAQHKVEAETVTDGSNPKTTISYTGLWIL